MPNRAPIVTVGPKTVFLNTAISAASLFSVSDPDGDPILKYRFMDFSNETTTGYFEFNGAARTNGSTIEINAGQLGNLFYVGAPQITSELIRVQAWDGQAWSDADVSFRMYTTRNQITKPVADANDATVLANESIPASSYISAFDPDGYPITKYYLRDDAVDHSYFKLGNQELAQRTYHTISAEQLNQLRYYGNGQGSETIRVFAFDGSTWSNVSIATFTTRPNLNRPTVNFTSLLVPIRESISIDNALSFQDADGNSIKAIQLWDTSSHSHSGYLTLEGEVLGAKQWHQITPNQLDDVEYVGAERQMNEVFAIRAYDGRYWSPIQRVTFNTVVRPKLASDRYIQTPQLEETPIRNIFDKIDDGPAHNAYEIVDMTRTPFGPDISGYFSTAGVKLTQGVVHSLTVSDFNATNFVSGPYEAVQNDEIYARAHNGLFWSDWTRVNIQTHPEFDRALVVETGPNDLLDWNDFPFVLPAPSVISYSFMQAFPSYDSGDATADTFSRFTSDQRNGARRAFAAVQSYVNVTFVEVPDSQVDPFTGALGGIIRMGNYFDDADDAPAAYAFLPGPNEPNGDIWINTFAVPTFGWGYGTRAYTTFMHELGHAMGLKHPFDGSPRLPLASDNDNFTVMSYTGRPDFLQPSTHRLYDIYNFQQLYGANMTTATGDDTYGIGMPWPSQDSVWTIWDAAGNDTMSAVDSLNDALIDLREGGFSSIGTAVNNIGIAFGVTIENAIGSANDDIIIGNSVANVIDGGSGDDIIRGYGGNDMLTGGANNDTFQLGIGDGRDIIDEQRKAGWDTIEFQNFPNFDDFSTDLSFRSEDRDLIIEYTMDQGLSQGAVRIKNQKWGSYRVETLRMGGTSVDLTNLYAQATPELTRFRTINQTSQYGSLVVPI